jgi:hypothetical protein
MKTLAQIMQQYATKFDLDKLEGIKETAIDGVWFYRSSKATTANLLFINLESLFSGRDTRTSISVRRQFAMDQMTIWWLEFLCL